MAGPGDHEVVTRSENGFEERLADFRARVLVAHERPDGSEVVTIDGPCAGRADLVEAEQADDSERQPAQRRE